MNNSQLHTIREAFGRIAYSHKTHEKAAERNFRNDSISKWVNIVLSTFTLGSLVISILTDVIPWLYVSVIFSVLSLGFLIFYLSFTPAKVAERHKAAANELWSIREKYTNLIADVHSEQLSDEEIIRRRDELQQNTNFAYKFAPATSNNDYEAARSALKFSEELTFTDEEIDELLPDELRIAKLK